MLVFKDFFLLKDVKINHFTSFLVRLQNVSVDERTPRSKLTGKHTSANMLVQCELSYEEHTGSNKNLSV